MQLHQQMALVIERMRCHQSAGHIIKYEVTNYSHRCLSFVVFTITNNNTGEFLLTSILSAPISMTSGDLMLTLWKADHTTFGRSSCGLSTAVYDFSLSC